MSDEPYEVVYAAPFTAYAADPTNWWIPNRACVEAMLRSSGFQVIGHPEIEVYLCRHCDRPQPDGAVYPAGGGGQ